MATLRKRSLGDLLADSIRQDIESGAWITELPGYRKLAARYGVSRPTCETAVRLLEQEGLISHASPGAMRKILNKSTPPGPSRKRTLLVITDQIQPPQPSDASIIHDIATGWRGAFGNVEFVTGDLQRNQRPNALLRRWINQSAAGCLLMFSPGAAWIQEAEACGLPCYALGGDFAASRGVISGTGSSAPIFLAQRLREGIDSGHQRILVVMARYPAPATLREHMRKLMPEPTNGTDLEITMLTPRFAAPEEATPYWSKVLNEHRPTLVIVDAIFEAVSLHGHCTQRGIKLPQELSIVVMDDEPTAHWLIPPLTCYRFPGEKAARHFQRWAKQGFKHGNLKDLPVEFSGGSTFDRPATTSELKPSGQDTSPTPA